MNMEIILRYFPGLMPVQKAQFGQLLALYEAENAAVNLISRKDMGSFYLHHVLHSLAPARFVRWPPACEVLDLGTGGGFPLIPLAILFPEVQFTGIDGTGKKVRAAQRIAEALSLQNVRLVHARAEEFRGQFHFIVSRAVCTLDALIRYGSPLLRKKNLAALPNGIIAYKGGNLTGELKGIRKGQYFEVWPLCDHFTGSYFEEKVLIYLQH